MCTKYTFFCPQETPSRLQNFSKAGAKAQRKQNINCSGTEEIGQERSEARYLKFYAAIWFSLFLASYKNTCTYVHLFLLSWEDGDVASSRQKKLTSQK